MRIVLLLVLSITVGWQDKPDLPGKLTIYDDYCLTELLKSQYMGKLSTNFDLREFVPQATFKKWGDKSIWFIDTNIVKVAEFYKKFWFDYFTKKYAGTGKVVKSVSININNWHLGGTQQYRGYRPPEYDGGGKESQHRFGRGFDCDIIIHFTDGTSLEADYKEVHQVIKTNEKLFFDNGVRAIEDIQFAPTWLHTDTRETGIKEILVVKPAD